MRASVVAEKQGVPSVTDVCSAFQEQARLIARMSGLPGAALAVYPGHIETQSPDQHDKTINEVIAPQIIKALTEPLEEAPAPPAPKEPQPRDIVFSGDYDEINEYFLDKQWSDGLPIVPPTIQKVEQFLKFTDRSPDEVIGVLPPANRPATVWSVAVNGVLSGCRPEYMPILLAMVEVMAEPRFALRDAGATPGFEAQVILNGPIIKQLKFNCKVGALRPGFQANSSCGRFWRMYMRNVVGSLPGVTDKGTWGRNFNVVLCENHDALKEIGWEPLSVGQGFDAEDNVVTVQSVRGRGYDIAVKGSTAKENLDIISYA
ncbi:MAG: hypothetical protein HYX90_10570, partial [Chloroflexi bacterium]|nr:hypothetical protein [Chloroflexota bacterium]